VGEAAAASGARRVWLTANLWRRGVAGEVAGAVAAALGTVCRGRISIGGAQLEGETPPLKSVRRLSASGLPESVWTSVALWFL